MLSALLRKEGNVLFNTWTVLQLGQLGRHIGHRPQRRTILNLRDSFVQIIVLILPCLGHKIVWLWPCLPSITICCVNVPVYNTVLSMSHPPTGSEM